MKVPTLGQTLIVDCFVLHKEQAERQFLSVRIELREREKEKEIL